jgi:hypothetical protein
MADAAPVGALTRLSWRQTIIAGVLAMWLGGIAMYATVVVPVGAGVLGSHEAFGFVTRRVAIGLNSVASGTLSLVLWNLLWKCRHPATRTMWITFAIMSASQVALYFLHPWLDAMLDAEQGRILDKEVFYDRHRVYLLVTMVQWFAGVVHFRSLLDRRA